MTNHIPGRGFEFKGKSEPVNPPASGSSVTRVDPVPQAATPADWQEALRLLRALESEGAVNKYQEMLDTPDKVCPECGEEYGPHKDGCALDAFLTRHGR